MYRKIKLKPLLALAMSFITLLGVMPFNVHALENGTGGETEATFVYIDGERVDLDDDRILNVVTVQPTIMPMQAGIEPFAESGSAPNVTSIVGVSGDFEQDPDVRMDGYKVGAGRYMTLIDGITYESFCCDPLLKGPENAGAVYDMTGEADAKLINAVKNGFPINTEWSKADLDDEERMWYAYVTRVAVAMANNPSRTFTGEDATIDQARELANGEVKADTDAYPAIMLNGSKDAKDTGRTINDETAQSIAFDITQNRKTSVYYNPFRFEWAAGTPDGARLVVDGEVIATAPDNPDTIFKDDITSFQIEMPNEPAFASKTATVNLVGIHNQFADKVWLMQNPDNPGGWQDIIFYIPEVSASAAFSFGPEPFGPDPDPDPGAEGVVIQKIDALTRKNIPGALVRLQGVSAATATLPDGQIISFNNTGINISQVLSAGATVASGDVKSTVKDGVWTLEGLPYGMYMVYEERAPQNYSLLPQHTAYGFFLAPPDIEVKVEMPELEFDGSANESSVSINITLGDDVDHSGSGGGDPEAGWSWEDSFTVTPPLPDFEIVETPNTNAVLITFENYPFGKIEVNKYDMVTELPLGGAHFRIQGYFAEGNTNGMPIDRVGVTGGDGKLVFEDLPAGHYTITEIEAPGGYELDYDEYRAISLTWGQTASTSFYNKPKTFVDVIKIDGDDSSKLLDGAVFRLTDPTSGEIWEGTTVGGKVRLGAGEGSYGNQLEAGLLYILTEIQAPPGYVLDPSPKEVILAANNQLNIITVSNFKKPTLTITKYDELTNKPLAGASFRLWRTEGETWSETQVTDENGIYTWTDLDPGIYSIQEIDEPFGYFKDSARKEILLEGGDNKQLEFFNRPRPVLTILKRDQVTGEPLEGVKFKVQRLEGETIGEFLTDSDGKIELSPRTGYLLEEKIYRVTEVQPPSQYLLDENPTKDVLLKWYEPTELVFENLLKPTLIFIKRNGLSGYGISNATYRVQYESPTGGVTTLGSYKTKCGLIVLPYVTPGWYVLTETLPAPGYSLPTNPTQRFYLAPGENSYTHAQTQEELYVDPRTNPNSGNAGACGECCGYLCSTLCANNCGNPGGGSGGLIITNGNGDPLGSITLPSTNPDTPSNPSTPTLTAGAVTRNSSLTATVQLTSSIEGKIYYAAVNSGANAPTVATGTGGTACSAGSNTITVHLTAGVKDVYFKVKDADGNVSDALKVTVPAYSSGQSVPESDPPLNFDDIVIVGGTVVYLNPEFSGITITFGGK